MRTIVAQLLCLALLSAHSAMAAGEAERTKEFEDYRCKVTLPGPDFQWLDHTKISDCVAFLGDASGTVALTVLVQKNEQSVAINERFANAYDEGFIQPGVASKISGRIGSFRGVPCYELHARLEQNESICTIRVFAANGYVYQLQLIGSELPVNERGSLEPIFSAFEFVGEPVLPASGPADSNEAVAGPMAKYRLIALVSLVIVAVVVLAIRDWLRRRRARGSSEQRG